MTTAAGDSLFGSAMRAVCRGLQTRGPAGPVSRVVRAAVFTPIFSLWFALLKVRAAAGQPKAVIGTTLDGDRFTCHPPDLVQMYVYLFGVWEPDLSSFIRSRLAPGDAFIDVGANVGYFSMLAARQVGSEGAVAAIDASPAITADLTSNVTANERAAIVRIVNRAVAAETGTLTIHAGPPGNRGLSTTLASRGLPAEAKVESGPLADFLTPDEVRTARLVKVDVEGGEPAVLRGLATFLQEARPDVELLVELSPHWWPAEEDPVRLLQPFLDAGFHVYTLPNNYWPWRYLWPDDVARPRRFTGSLADLSERVDLVLSREDRDVL